MDNKNNPNKSLPAQEVIKAKTLFSQNQNNSFNEEEDESGGGGGGLGKALQGFFKREKLEKLIGQKKLKSKFFETFLNHNETDKHTLDETTLEKFAHEHEEKESNEKKAKEIETQVETIEERQADLEVQKEEVQKEMASDPTVINAKKTSEKESTKIQATQLKIKNWEQTVDREETTRQGIMGNKKLGSIISASHGNPIGFAKPLGTVYADKEKQAEAGKNPSNPSFKHK